ncbi:MAG: 4-(cytidine 5'-diphospho)-2-C-methyl-D-erythritol kinase [Verrucomicrobiia bacterium]
MSIQRRAPCKINLLLNILGRRPDGFHQLETIMWPVPVFDELELDAAPGGVRFFCSDNTLPTDSSNLVVRATEAFLLRTRIRPGVRIFLRKNIPVAAGLGGGSSDAAQTIVGLNRLFGEPLDAAALHELAASLGSDVPFFLNPAPALATGRGEQIKHLEQFEVLERLWLFLAYPGFGVSTRWAYQALQRFPTALNGSPGRAERMVSALQQGDLHAAMSELYNTLESPVLAKFPILQLYKEFLREAGAVAAMMSGSGSSTFAFFPDENTAVRVQERFLERFGAACWTRVVPARFTRTALES